MCYTIEINLTREQLEKRFNAQLDKHLLYRKQNRVSAFALPECPVICTGEPETIKLYKWGLIPSWSNGEKFAREIRMKTFNARAETLMDKPSFRHLVRSKKCLVITNGFYEWQTRDKEKQPYYINVKDTEAIALAGLFDSWSNKETGEVLDTFTVITTVANPMMEKIHNTKKRMPVILHREDEEKWIDPDMPVEKTLAYLKPFDERLMVAEEVERGLFSRTLSDGSEASLF